MQRISVLNLFVILFLCFSIAPAEAGRFGDKFKKSFLGTSGGEQNTPQSGAVQLTYALPEIAIVSPGGGTQVQGGVTVQMASPSYSAQLGYRTECKQRQAMLTVNNQLPYDIIKHPGVIVEPDRIDFKVSITNQLKHILKLEGAVFVLSVNGEEKQLEAAAVSQFHKGRILPRKSKEFTLRGPIWKSLAPDSVISFAIYDIVTETDGAGKVSARGSFEWDFQFSKAEKVMEGQRTVQFVKMTEAQARQTCR